MKPHLVTAVLFLALCLSACGEEREVPMPLPGPPSQGPGDGADKPDPGLPGRLHVTIGDVVFPAVLSNTPTAAAFVDLLPMTATMRELNGNEKYYYLPSGLPGDSTAPGQVSSGDLMLFGSDCLVLFYEPFVTSYRYARIGRIENQAGLAEALGKEDVTVKFEIKTDE